MPDPAPPLKIKLVMLGAGPIAPPPHGRFFLVGPVVF
jgi:hypothetical protein